MEIFKKSTFSSLKIRNYRLYFIGQAISLCGTWMQSIGQAWLVLKLTNSGAALGLVAAAQFLPILFFGPFGGVIADRFSKRKLLYFTQSVSGVLALILGILIMTQTVQIWMVYVLALGLGFVNTIDNPTRQTFVIEMVGKEQLPNAISLNSGQFNLARVVGPALAGTLIAIIGLAPCFILNAVSFLAVLIALYMMRQNELRPAPLVAATKGQLREGFKYVQSSPVLRNTLWMMAIIGTLSYEFSVSLPLYAQFTFHSGATGYAALTGAMGLGAVFGGLYTANRKNLRPAMLTKAALMFGIVMLLSAIAPNIQLALLAMAVLGFYSINFTSLGNVTLQLESSPEMRGRVMALWTVAFLGSTPIGGPIVGYASQFAGPRWGLALGGFAALMAAALGRWSGAKQQSEPIPLEVETLSERTAIEGNAKIR